MKIFISHIHEESPFALVLKDWIESSFLGHVKVFVSSDVKDVPAGSRWLNEIDVALDDSQIYLVLCSPQSIRRPWINFETGCAWIKDVPVIPICHSGMTKSTLPKPLSEFQALDLASDESIDDLFESLAGYLSLKNAPRIDKAAMWFGIITALEESGATIDGSGSEEEEASVKIDSKPMDILKRIADLGDKGYSVEELSGEFQMSEPKMEYYLDELKSRKLLKRGAILLGVPPQYSLTAEGRKYLVDQGLL